MLLRLKKLRLLVSILVPRVTDHAPCRVQLAFAPKKDAAIASLAVDDDDDDDNADPREYHPAVHVLSHPLSQHYLR